MSPTIILFFKRNANSGRCSKKLQGHSDVVSCRNVSEYKVFDLRDVHGLFDGCVSAADLKKATFQRVLTDDDGEKNAHLIVSALHPHRNTQARV